MRTLLTLICSFCVIIASVAEDISKSEHTEIEAVIRKETSQPILGMSKQKDGTVVVVSGVRRGARDGGGLRFILRREKSGWKVVKKHSWVS